MNTTKLFCEVAFTSAEDFVKVAEDILEQSGVVGDKITNIAYVYFMLMARLSFCGKLLDSVKWRSIVGFGWG